MRLIPAFYLVVLRSSPSACIIFLLAVPFPSRPACVNKADDNGYYPLQWAALNNRVAEANFLLSRGASVNSTDHTGQTALHWSSVRGSLPVVETLLRHNADYEQRDNRGYTAAHVAAQYGQTSVLYHLALKWAVDVDTQVRCKLTDDLC